MTVPADGMSERLGLLLRRLSLSNARLAQLIGVDKSLVGRWLAGAVRPGPHNLSRITELAAQNIPGFSLLDWERALPDFAAAIGADPGLPAARRPASKDSLGGYPFFTPEASRAEVARVGHAYPGLYRLWRQAFNNTGQVVLERLAIRRWPGGHLVFRCTDGAFEHHGLVLILRGLLFLCGEERERQDELFQMVLHGVNGTQALRLDGILLSVAGDRLHTPGAMIVAAEREAAYDPPPDAAFDEAWFAAIRAQTLAINRAGTGHDGAPPEILAQIANQVSPQGPDRVLRLPAERSIAVADTDDFALARGLAC
jgi:transcriptional regulator with XRE-family HTH domain